MNFESVGSSPKIIQLGGLSGCKAILFITMPQFKVFKLQIVTTSGAWNQFGKSQYFGGKLELNRKYHIG